MYLTLMAFDIKDVLLDTRKSGITIDYVKSSRDALECLDHVQPKDIEDVNNDSIYQDWSKHEPLKISREALTYLSTLCCNSTPLKSSLIMTFGQSANLELPLLTTNHEDDLIDFKKAIATTKIRYMERPEGLDLSAIDKDLAGFDLEAQISMRKGYQVDKEGFKIGREALKYLQNLIGSKKPYNSGDEIIYHQVSD